MSKELYLYSPVYDYVVADLLAQMEENKTEDITVRVNSPGGSVFAGWGLIAKMQELGNVTMQVDGFVASMSLYMLLFADNVTCLDVSKGVLHRADMYVSSAEDQAFLDSVNKQLKEKLTAKIDAVKLKELKGVSIADIFNPDQRIDVALNAKEMKAIGLVDKIVKVNPSEVKALNARFYDVAAHSNTDPLKNPIMTKDELKSKHADVYAAILAEGVEKGIATEKDRVEACLAFIDIDPAGVKAAIEAGKPLTQKAMADFTVKALSKENLKKISADNADKTITDEVATKEKTEKEKELAAFEAGARKNLGVVTPKA